MNVPEHDTSWDDLCRYAQHKFAASHSLSDDMPLATLCTQLPHTRAWLALASGQLPSLVDLPTSNQPRPAAQLTSAPQVWQQSPYPVQRRRSHLSVQGWKITDSLKFAHKHLVL